MVLSKSRVLLVLVLGVGGWGERRVRGGADAGRLRAEWHRGLAAAIAGLGGGGGSGGGGGVDGVVIVSPPDRTVCRVLEAPGELVEEVDESGVAEACELLAEGALPGGVEDGRRGAMLVRSWRGSAWGGSGGAVLATGRLGSYDEVDGAGADPVWGVRRWAGRRWVRAVASPAALASLCARMGSVCRGAVWRGGSGVAVVVADQADRLVARVTRVDTDSAGAETSAFGRLLELIGAEDSAGEAGGGGAGVRVGLVGDSDGVLGGFGERVPTDVAGLRGWMRKYGLAFGAALAGAEAGGEDGVDDRGAMLRVNSGSDRAALHQRVWSWALRPRHAAALICLGVLFGFGAPVGAEAVRVAVLRSRAGDVETRVAEARREAALYDTISNRLLPMTKLMSDVAQAAPVGVRLDRVQISVGGGLDVRGQAESPELVDSFVGNLGRTGVFGEVRRPQRTEAGGVTEFQVTAQVRSPLFHAARPIEDFAATPLAVRLYGEEASGSYESESGLSGGRGDGGASAGSTRSAGSAGSSDRASGARPAAGSRTSGGRAGGAGRGA